MRRYEALLREARERLNALPPDFPEPDTAEVLLLRTVEAIEAHEAEEASQLQGAVEAERARIIERIRHIAAGYRSPEDPHGIALCHLADLLERDVGQLAREADQPKET